MKTATKQAYKSVVSAARDTQVPKNLTSQGKRKGKSNEENTEYRQVSSWLRKTTYTDVRKRLADLSLELDKRQEFSELVESLLAQWLAEGGKAFK